MVGDLRERLKAFGKDCVEHGDMTPQARTMLDRIADDAQIASWDDRPEGLEPLPEDWYKGVTRVHVIHPEERAYGVMNMELWADHWQIYIMDEGRTLKAIAKGDGKKAEAARNAALAEDLKVQSLDEKQVSTRKDADT